MKYIIIYVLFWFLSSILFSNYNCLHIFIHKSKNQKKIFKKKERKYYKTQKKSYLTKKSKKNQKVYQNQKKVI